MVYMEEQKTEDSDLKSLQEDNEKIKKVLEERKQLIAQRNELISRDKMGGKSEMTPPPKKVEVSPKEYAEMALRGKLPQKD